MKRILFSQQIDLVRGTIRDSILSSPLGTIVADALGDCTNGGKMLRSRFLLRLAAATNIPMEDRLNAAAALELIHVASLVHDDIIDHGHVRRGRPTLWVEKGVKGAVLLGDFLVCRAMGLFSRVASGSLSGSLASTAEEMCIAEVEQDLLLQDKAPDWDACLRIARRKTGSLFALAGEVAAGQSEPLKYILREAGYSIGTAYQLADDMLDAFGDPLATDKTIGNDLAHRKVTAASASAAKGGDPVTFINSICTAARGSLAEWNDIQKAWDEYMSEDIGPVMDSFLQAFVAGKNA